ncbi:MAG: TonB-dependent receptor [Pseudomonadota bacterium]|nr:MULTISPECIES: TonB-dependent receptor [unclassified Phenylobacterium]MBT9472666.1 TonB-dependent receptor [Phenylobacterium sp.]
MNTTGLGITLRGLLLAGALTAPATSALAQQIDEVVVTGRRVSEAAVAIGTDEPTATVSITRDALLSAPAGITGLKMLESLPGFNVQANDALGMYEFGNSVTVRAFSFTQIGFLLDDVPMGRSDQFGGSPIYRYVDNENLLRVQASSGAGDVSLPSYASLGTIVDYFTTPPKEAFGGAASVTFGSDSLFRNFLRLDTGEHKGLSAYVARSDIQSDLWRGAGDISREHIEGKIRYRAEGGQELTFQAVYNDYFDYDSPAITKAQYEGPADQFGRSGRFFPYLNYVPSLTPAAPGVTYSNALYNQYYKQAINSRTDYLYALTFKSPVGENIDLSATGYYEDKQGYGVSPEAYATSLASHNAERLIIPGLVAPRGLQYGLSTIDGTRKGISAKAEWRLANHKIQAGAWYENDEYHRTQARYNHAGGNPDAAPLLNEPVHLQRDFVSTRETRQFFLKDIVSLLDDRLKLDLGFKGLWIDYDITGSRNPADYIARRTPTLSAKWEDSFLPQIGAVYDLTGREQVFASYSENMALPRGADDVFSAASPTVPAPEAETAKNWELGVRTNRPTFNASFVLYQTKFANRLQSFASTVPGSTTTETFFQNVGEVDAYGAEFSGQWKPDLFAGKVYFNGNLSYNHAEFQDNYTTVVNGVPTIVPIAGKIVPDFPEWVAQAGVTFEPTDWALFNISARHISDRYTNFINSEKTDGYTVWNAYMDIGQLGEGPLSRLKFRLNVDNIFDEDYLGTITTTTTTLATFRPGPPRSVQLTLSAEF